MGALNFTPFPSLATNRLSLRQLSVSDAEAIQTLRSDERVNRYIKRANNITVDDALAFISKINGFIAINQSMYWAVTLKTDDKLIGTLCLWNFADDNSRAEIGYELHPDFQKRGIMQESMVKVLDYAFNTLSLQTVEACVHEENVDSLNLLNRNNFKRTDQSLPDEPGFNIYELSRNEFAQSM